MAKVYANILKVGGVVLPPPSSMKCSDYDITDSDRNAKGVMIMEMIRENVHKLECSWNILRPDEYMIIRNAIANKYNLATEYFIPDMNQKGTITAYVGDRTTPVYCYENGDPNKPVYKGFTVNFVEM